MSDLPEEVQIIIIGGGVIGCSVAYHLAQMGATDCVLLERQKLTSGTTWHAAGLIAQLRATQNMTRLAKYSQELYADLEQETGVATGFRQNGSLTVALTEERLEELTRSAAMARSFGVEISVITPDEVKERYPLLNTSDVLGGVHLPKDGQGDPANIALALAKGARQKGIRIFEDTKVTGITKAAGRVTGVQTPNGHIRAKYVVNCAGMWGREVGLMAGARVPLHACEHFYIVTEAMPALPGSLPVLRVPDECAYYKEDAGKILLGAFEPNAKPWGMDGIPDDFCFDQLPEDLDQFAPILEAAVNRFPALETTGIHTFFNGPESFTADDRYLLGPSPEVENFFVAAGFNSIGIQSGGGAGKVLAEWLVNGEAPFDIWDVDIRRIQPFQNNARYLKERVSETLGLLYADHFPYRQYESSRNIRRSPLHFRLQEAGACFGEAAGWERPNWFLPQAAAEAGEEAAYAYSWKRQNWFDYSAAEHQAVRQRAGLFDLSSFGKIRVEGPDACDFLQLICAADVDVPEGKIVYTTWLNGHGGIEADLTVTRLTATCFLLITPAATVTRNLAWLHDNMPTDAFCVVTDVTAGEAVLAVMGPNSRAILSAISPADFSNEAFPFGTAQVIELGMVEARAHRITYVGELGWEIYVSSDQAVHVYDAIMAAGADHGLQLAGLHALDSCRIEKAYRHFGHDITDEDDVVEAGLGFTARTRKQPGRFGPAIGTDAVIARRAAGVTRTLMQFRLTDPEPLLYHNEPIIRDGSIVGYLSSGNYGHYLGGAIGMGYVPLSEGETLEDLDGSHYQIDIAGTLVSAEATRTSLYDPQSTRVKS